MENSCQPIYIYIYTYTISKYTLYNLISYNIISYHVISYHIMLYHIISCYIISYHVISYHIISYHVISYYIQYHIKSYHITLHNKTSLLLFVKKNTPISLLPPGLFRRHLEATRSSAVTCLLELTTLGANVGCLGGSQRWWWWHVALDFTHDGRFTPTKHPNIQ